MDEQAMTVRLPKDLHERLRRVGFELRIPMNAIVTEAVAERVASLEAAARAAAEGTRLRAVPSADQLDPIMKRLAGLPQEGGQQ